MYHRPGYGLRPYEASHRHTAACRPDAERLCCGGLVRRARTLGRNGPLLKGDVMPGQKTSGRMGLRICPPPPAGFDPFAASSVDLARHGLPLRPDPQTQPDLAALWERLADRYRDFEHLEPRPDTATANKKAARETAAPSLLPLDPQESCGYSLFGSQATPFTALFRHLDRSRPAVQPGPVHAC